MRRAGHVASLDRGLLPLGFFREIWVVDFASSNRQNVRFCRAFWNSAEVQGIVFLWLCTFFDFLLSDLCVWQGCSESATLSISVSGYWDGCIFSKCGSRQSLHRSSQQARCAPTEARRTRTVGVRGPGVQRRFPG